MTNQPIQQFFGLQKTVFAEPYIPPPGPTGSLLYALDLGRTDLVYSDTYSTNAVNGDSVVSVKSTVGDWGFLQVIDAASTPVYNLSGPTGSYIDFDGSDDFMEMTTSPTGATGTMPWPVSLQGDDYTFYMVAANKTFSAGSPFSFGGTWTTYGPKLYYYGGDFEWSFGNWASAYVDGTSWSQNYDKYIIVCRGSKTNDIDYQVAVNGSLLAAEVGSPSSSYDVGAPPRGRSMIGGAANNTAQWTGSVYREWEGRMYEYGCFDAYLTDAQRTTLFNFLNAKHNIY